MQVWLTFEETGELLHCSPAAARKHAIANQWERRRGSDGITRVILPLDSARKFIISYATKESAPAPQEPAERAETATRLPENGEPTVETSIPDPEARAFKETRDARMCQRSFQQSVIFLADPSTKSVRLQPLAAKLTQNRNVWPGRAYAHSLAPGLHPRFAMSCWEGARLGKSALC